MYGGVVGEEVLVNHIPTELGRMEKLDVKNAPRN